MYEYIRALIIGYNEGLKNKTNKNYIRLNKSNVISKLYDIGYIEGQNSKKTSSNNKKYIV